MRIRTLAALVATFAACSHSEPSATLQSSTGTHEKGEEGVAVAPGVVATSTAFASALPQSKPTLDPTSPLNKDGEDKEKERGEIDGLKGPLGHVTAHAPRTGVADQANASPIRAGEWDDNANYREFQRYLGTVSEPIHQLDVRARRFLIVRDSEGKAVPHCPITITDSAQHSVTLTTTASGRAILFPHAEDLAGKDFTATAACTEDTVHGKFSLNDDTDGTVDLKMSKPRQLSSVRTVDLAFVLDTTGSMSEEIASVKTTIQKVAQTLQGQQVSIRVGLVEYKDRGDQYVTKVYPMSSDLTAFSNQVAGIVASGGGDMPEDMNAGLHTALNQLEWNTQAVTRAAFIIGDAAPHLDYQNEADYAADMKIAAHRGIQLFTVAASGMDPLGQAVWRQMAAYTGATNLFVLRGGAGPQSVGGGDPIASCGGTQTNYASGNLDALIVAKIKRELKSLDVDPMKIPGLITDENAKPCDQRIVFWQ